MSILCAETMAEQMASEVKDDQMERERSVVRVKPEDYELESKDHTAVKVICLGDSAVGKSKSVPRILNSAHLFTSVAVSLPV